jgi:hypothetical protein
MQRFLSTHICLFIRFELKMICFLKGGDMQHGKVERTVHSGKGTGELSFFFGMRHLGTCFGLRVEL